jgi:hypothetical protein
VVSVTGVAAGTATISVTATDPGGLSSKQTFAVTVTAADAVPDPDPDVAGCGAALDNGKTCEVTIGEDQILESADTQRVSVTLKTGSKTVWTVKGLKKGETEVRIINSADRKIVSTFTITVNNQAPELQNKAKRPLSEVPLITMTPWELHKDTLKRARPAYLIPLDASTYVTDKDGDKLTYVGEADTPHVIILEYLDGSGGKPTGFVVDVTDSARDFQLSLQGEDDDKAKSEKAAVAVVRGTMPRSWTYPVEQFGNGDLRTETIGMRRGVDHILSFMPVSVSSPNAVQDDYYLEFIQDWVAAWKAATKNDLTQDLVDDLVNVDTVKPDDDDDAATQDLGDGYLTITTTGPVIITADRDEDDPSPYDLYIPVPANTPWGAPMLKFSLTGGTGKATIKIALNVWYDSDTTSAEIVSTWHAVDSETLELDIQRVMK